MQDARINAQVHRFGNNVAIFLDNGSTVYLPASAARTIGEALIAGADDINNEPDFCKSTIGSKEWTFNGKR
jgi:hypothetical protein